MALLITTPDRSTRCDTYAVRNPKLRAIHTISITARASMTTRRPWKKSREADFNDLLPPPLMPSKTATQSSMSGASKSTF
jgi:hypothetical protein